GLDAVWADDFHHQIRRALAGDFEGYYANYTGSVEDLARTIKRGWFYEGQIYQGTGEPRGTLCGDIRLPAFIHCIQNHDQVGNRATGARLNHEIPLAAYRAASALLLLGPFTPLLFMGQEWAASSPFLYFTDHNEELGRLVTEGRRAEFASFSAFADEAKRAQIPDPQAETTFLRSKLNWEERDQEPHASILHLYQQLLSLRQSHPALRERSRESVDVLALNDNALAMRRADGQKTLLLVVNLRDTLRLALDALELPSSYNWNTLLSTEEQRFGGEGGAALEQGILTMEGPGAIVLEATL
ncbi:MAG: DUF3459 domain-containing protein, partial [Chloroflexota bacterium]|nr:DUF3459 domain-containing protein [Chloroflexota bacterium]